MSPSTHPTKAALISTAVRLLDERPLSDITTELLLHESGVSRSSLYHHFADFGELIEDAEVVRFTRYVDYSIAMITESVLAIRSRDELRQALARVTRSTQSQAMAAVRSQRITALADASRNARYAAKLGAEQERLTDALADLIREGQARGLMNPALDPRAVAVLIQAYTVGKVVDDITPQSMAHEAWVALIDAIVDRVFIAN